MRPTSTRTIPSSTALRALLQELFAAAVRAVDPEVLVRERVRVQAGRFVVLDTDRAEIFSGPLPDKALGAGKAAAAMASAVEAIPGLHDLSGTVVVPDGYARRLGRIRCLAGSHPVPDRRGFEATRQILNEAAQIRADRGALVLISGGASSLLVQPRPPLTLDEKIAVNRLLLECGAAIEELNTVRKHLSLVKGGGLLRQCRGEAITILLSDVVGDDPAVIGSGPAVPDPTTFADALAVLDRYELRRRVPQKALAMLEAGIRGDLPETVKPHDPEAGRSRVVIIGSNAVATAAAEETARRKGWEGHRVREPLRGETRAAARDFAGVLRAELRLAQRENAPRYVVAGGETIVEVRGNGKGGRNQEFALVVAQGIEGLPIHVLSAGTDGIDGPTDVAGAFADGSSVERAREKSLDIDAALSRNDSYPLLERLGDHFRSGPTGTNVMDIKIALVMPG